MNLNDFYIISTSISGKGIDDIGSFELTGRIDNGNVLFSKSYLDSE